MTNVFKKYVSFYRDDFKLVGILFNHGRSLLNKKGYQEINLSVRIQLSSRFPDLSLERVNAIQDGAKSIKKGSSHFTGERCFDFQEEVVVIPVSIRHSLYHLDLIVHPFQYAGIESVCCTGYYPAHISL